MTMEHAPTPRLREREKAGSHLTVNDTEALLKLQDDAHRLIKVNNKMPEEIHMALVKARAITLS